MPNNYHFGFIYNFFSHEKFTSIILKLIKWRTLGIFGIIALTNYATLIFLQQCILSFVIMILFSITKKSNRLITCCVTTNWVCYKRLSYKLKHLSLEAIRFVMGVIDHKNTFQYDVKLIDVYVLEKNLIAYAHECTFKIHNLHIFCTLKHFVPFYIF